MARKFVYDGREFADPGAEYKTPEAVRQWMSQFVPELSNASIKTTKEGQDTVHTFERRVGTKGRG
jgi:PRTRC genetic system protein C